MITTNEKPWRKKSLEQTQGTQGRRKAQRGGSQSLRRLSLFHALQIRPRENLQGRVHVPTARRQAAPAGDAPVFQELGAFFSGGERAQRGFVLYPPAVFRPQLRSARPLLRQNRR